MELFEISNPDDRQNPFENLLGADPLMFHGTSSMFCPFIERQGFRCDSFDAAFGQHIRAIVDACDKLHFGGLDHACAGGLGNKDNRHVYFTASFSTAQRYARNLGGERIQGALRSAHDFLVYLSDDQRLQRQIAKWKQGLREHGSPHQPTEQVIANLQDSDLHQRLAQQVEVAHAALRLASNQCVPVVYAVLSDRKWIGGGDPTIPGSERENSCGITVSELPIDRIVARVDFINGISNEPI